MVLIFNLVSLYPIYHYCRYTGYSDILYVLFDVLILIFTTSITISDKSLYPVTL